MSALSDAANSLNNYAKTLEQMAKVLKNKADRLTAMDASLGQIISVSAIDVGTTIPTLPYTTPDLSAPAPAPEPVQSVAAPVPEQGALVTDIGGSTIETAMNQHTDVPVT